jgi:hypothetical protein
MGFKDWDNIPFGATDCIRDNTEWNNMVTYIKHSAASIFTIYDDEDSSNQIFKFTYSGTISQMFGGADSGDDLYISANDSNSYPRISLFGDSDIWLNSADDIFFKQTGTQMAKISYAANVTTFEGGGIVADDLLLKGNSVNDYSAILIEGTANIHYYCTNTFAHLFYEGNANFLSLYEDGTNDVIEGKITGNDLKLLAVEGIHNYFKAGEEFKLFDGTTEALKVTYAANVTTIEGGAVSGDDLILKGSSANDYSKIVIAGNSNMEFYVPDGGGIFKFYDGADWCGFMQDDVPNTSFVLGTQSNKDLWFKPNGTGLVRFGTYAAITTETLAGFITMNDDGGVSRKVAIVA